MNHPYRRVHNIPISWTVGLLILIMLVFAACVPISAPIESKTDRTEVDEAGHEADHADHDAEPTEMAGKWNPDEGAYIFNVAIGCGCHFNSDLDAFAGGAKFEGSFGVVYASNLTADLETGLGSWTDEQIANALRLGMRPADAHHDHDHHENVQLHPIMPYQDYSALSDQDVMNLVAYLRTFEAVENALPERELTTEVPVFTPAQEPVAKSSTEPIARGEYLVQVARCGRCHTPTDENGQPDMERLLAGAPLRDQVAPNLTPDEATGMGFWSIESIAHFLRTAEYDDGLKAEGAMAAQVDRGLNQLTEEDALAIAAYLQSLPPVENMPTLPE